MAPARALTGWGMTSPSTADLVPPTGIDEVASLVRSAGPRGVLARGLARSYGDAAQNGGGTVLDMAAHDRILAVDVEAGVVDVEAGASLDTLMRRLLPLGLWVPVSPGTRMVTVGGAIAADIHGKNHHVDGSFGQHVLSLDLLVADGSTRTLTPAEPLFWATVGGMGLTGIVLRARVRMKHVESAYCVVDTERAKDLDDLLDRMTAGDHRYTYSVAWIDCVARGARMGRAVLTRGWSADRDQLPRRLRRNPLQFDPCPPGHGTCGVPQRAAQQDHRGGVQRALVPQGSPGAPRTGAGHRLVLPPARRSRRLEPCLRAEGIPAVPARRPLRRRGTTETMRGHARPHCRSRPARAHHPAAAPSATPAATSVG